MEISTQHNITISMNTFDGENLLVLQLILLFHSSEVFLLLTYSL